MFKSKLPRVYAIAVFIVLLITFAFFQSNSLSPIRQGTLPDGLRVFTPQAEGKEQQPIEVECVKPDTTDWSKFAYTQYVTNTAYLCNSVMLFEILHRLGSKADRLMMYPESFAADENSDTVESRLLLKAKNEYNVKLQPIKVQSRLGGDSTWAESFTKLLAFNQTQYTRVLSLDSDSTILKTMDELFLLPPAPIAIPRAYWLKPEDHILSSQIVLIQPSAPEFARIEAAIDSAANNDYDMEIVNQLYNTSAMIIPHRPYNILTGEWRSKGQHLTYLGNEYEEWDPQRVLDEAKFLHFSDWPVPKPWLQAAEKVKSEKEPKCDADKVSGEMTDCRARDIWRGFYADFATRREEICGISVNRRKRDLIDEQDIIEEIPQRWEPIFD